GGPGQGSRRRWDRRGALRGPGWCRPARRRRRTPPTARRAPSPRRGASQEPEPQPLGVGGIGVDATQRRLRRGERLVDAGVRRLVHLVARALVGGGELRRLDPFILDQLFRVAIDRVVLLRPALQLVLGDVVLVVVLGVSLAAVRLHFDEVHALAAPRALGGVLRRG